MVMGDFDGDGVPDVAVYGITYDQSFNSFAAIEVHFGDGAGGFKSTIGSLQLPVNGEAGIAAADLAGTGQSQLLVALGNSISVRNWNGSTFDETTTIDLSATGITATKICVGNLTTTNSHDIVVSDDFGSVGVVWVPNDGAGHFGAPKTFAAGGIANAARILLADLNGDGLDDVILANATGSTVDHNGHGGSTVGVLLNNGSGSLGAEVLYGNPTLFGTPNSSFSGMAVTVADVDGDGKQDLISACYTHNLSTLEDTYYLSVNPGDGDGTFQDGLSFALPRGVQAIDSADFNNDGKADVATVDYSDSGFTITEWTGIGASLAVARQDYVPSHDGLFYDAITLGYMKTNGTFATFNNDTNVDVLIGTSSQIVGTGNSRYSQFMVFQNQSSGDTGGGGGGNVLPATTFAVGAINPGDPIDFAATQPSTAAGLTVQVQWTTTTNNEASWSDLDGNSGHLAAAGGGFYTNSTFLFPTGSGIYFRAISSAPGYTNSVSDPQGPYSIQSAQLRIGVALTSTSDPKGTLQIAHIGDQLTYTFTWTNVGNLTASNLVVETPVPSYIGAADDLD
ncbi:MAG TPA: FG-GAP-like repeat-containing protein, partial [Candidatus Polarisedimenticolia bacterium]|nr:FG-GAP-like repeat-containing protein [Candidatus Polarisedimenticolia bacterium]